MLACIPTSWSWSYILSTYQDFKKTDKKDSATWCRQGRCRVGLNVKAPPTVTPESHSSTFYSSSFANAYGNDFDDNVDVNNSNDDDTDGNDVRDFKNYKVNANSKKPTKSKSEFSQLDRN